MTGVAGASAMLRRSVNPSDTREGRRPRAVGAVTARIGVCDPAARAGPSLWLLPRDPRRDRRRPRTPRRRERAPRLGSARVSLEARARAQWPTLLAIIVAGGVLLRI